LRFLPWLVSFLLTLGAAAQSACAELDEQIRAVLADKLLARGELGIQIIRLGNSPGESRTIYQYRASVPRIPASNLKLVTTAAALEKLGSDFAFRTVLAMRQEPGAADLALVGDGDPSLGDAEMLRKLGWDVDTVFKTWAAMLQQRGVQRIRHLYVDDSIFDATFAHPNWPAEQEHKRYVAQVGGINLNVNCVDFYLRIGGYGQIVDYRTNPPDTRYISLRNACVQGTKNAVWLSRQRGSNDVVLRGETNANNLEPISVTIHDPPMYAGTVLAETLVRAGIGLAGSVQRDRTIRQAMLNPGPGSSAGPATQSADRWIPLAVHATPLATVLARANKDSINLYAEALCKRLGAAASGMTGSWDNGTAAMGAFLESLGVNRNEFTIDDGCGLSKKNLISPNAIARVLEHEFHTRDREVFVNSLAVAGTDGTFEERFKDSDLRGRVFGKSGYVRGVASLSGYLKARDDNWYAFSILMNEVYDYASAKVLQERIVKAIDAAADEANVASGR
ncbi:MAG TPA: D-alanyl-D-alanine carboxypeptidase/D-alanyl-D-alanine-endopeptidase, partial [Tepidisphaeraceae bacterium]|nr:D-alanyl-D-alanine carboxypeptidase/D-alanyl-D-alanine-endopeptidase [Tepidisphaeraceae bacterium]